MDIEGDALEGPEGVVARASRVLRAVSTHEPGGCTTTTLASDTRLARATAHRLLSSLHEEGLCDRDSHGLWHLGHEAYFLGLAAAPRHNEAEIARATVRRVSDQTGESAFFSARRGDHTVCLVREDGSFPVRSHVLFEGIRFPLGVASAGMAVLAFLPDVERERVLQQYPLEREFGTAHSEVELRRRIQETRAAGFATNPGLIVEGSWGLGAAVFDGEGVPRWALSITGIEARIATPRRERLGMTLLREAHRLSAQLERHRR